jgi:hypothetical protein
MFRFIRAFSTRKKASYDQSFIHRIKMHRNRLKDRPPQPQILQREEHMAAWIRSMMWPEPESVMKPEDFPVKQEHLIEIQKLKLGQSFNKPLSSNKELREKFYKDLKNPHIVKVMQAR